MESEEHRIATYAVSIQRTPEDLFERWANPAALPSILRHLHAHFEDEEALEPADVTPALTFEVAQSLPPLLLEWLVRVEAGVLYRGTATFRPAPPGRGTELRFTLELSEDTSALRKAYDLLRGRDPKFCVREDLRNFKQFMEAGEYPTTRGQPSGKRSLKGRALTLFIEDHLQRELDQAEAEQRPLRSRPIPVEQGALQ